MSKDVPAESGAPDSIKPAADARYREQALDPTASFIVQAPAGSGKTELLTRRVLTLLARVDEPEEILAITFTRKAASEMRQRVMEMLAAAQSDTRPDKPYEAEGWALAREVLERDAARGWQLMRNPQRLNLRTIDALCTQLAHRLPVVSELGAPAAVTEDAMPLYRQAAAQLLDAQAESLDLVLLQLGNRLDQAQKLLAEMLANRDQWQRYVLGDVDTNALRAVLERMLGELVESRLESLISRLPDDLADTVPALLREAARIFFVLDASTKADDVAAQTVLAKLESLPRGGTQDVAAWRAIAHAVLTRECRVRARVTRAQGFPTSGKDAALLDMSASDLKELKSCMGSLLTQLAEQDEFVEHLHEVRALPLGGYQDDDWELLAQLVRVLPDLLLQLLDVFAERGVIDFVEMALRAQTALGTEDEPTDLALALDLRLQHVLVDEFQDTSRTQFNLFKLLVAGWTPDDGRTFFAVGDPMQSIYRFRDADVTLFDQARQSGIGQLPLTPLTLSVNFRAAPGLINWVNETFVSLFPEHADAATGAVSYANSAAHLETVGGVQMHALVDQNNHAEAEQVAYLAAQAIEGDPTHRVAILVRSRAQAADIFACMQAQDIAYQAIDMDLLGDRPVVRDLLSLCLALRYPHDRLHWLALLRAPWCGLTLDDLHALMTDTRQEPVIDLLRDATRRQAVSEDGRSRIDRLLMVIEPAVHRAPRAAVMPWVEACWLQLGGPVVCRDASDLDAAERCIARLQHLEASGQLWQPSVLHTAMQSLYAAAGDDDAAQVQVMTLHKAKGLEFDTVIVPALARQPRSDQQQLLNWFESTIEGQAQLLLAPFTERGARPDPINHLVRQARNRCDAQEKLRLLYVACTRAKRHLHLVGQARHDKGGDLLPPPRQSLLHPLWPHVESAFAEAAALAAAQDTHKSEPQSPPANQAGAGEVSHENPQAAFDFDQPPHPSGASVVAASRALPLYLAS